MTVVVPRPQFIYGVGHCSYVPETGPVCNCAEDRESVNDRRCATTGAGVLTVLFLWRCRYCSSSMVVDIPVVWHRGSMVKLRENCRRPQVMSSISLSDCCIHSQLCTNNTQHTTHHTQHTTQQHKFPLESSPICCVTFCETSCGRPIVLHTPLEPRGGEESDHSLLTSGMHG